MQKKIGQFFKAKLLLIVIVLFVLLSISEFFALVGPGERGVVLRFGAVQERVLDEGIHLKLPYIDRIELVDVRTLKFEAPADSFSKDLQTISTTIALNYHIDPSRAHKLFQEVGHSYESRIIDPAIQEAVKSATAIYTAEELITKRTEVKNKIKEVLKERLLGRDLLIDEFSITNFDFSREFNQAIESKQQAEQLALKAERDLRRVKIEAQQKIEAAKAEAEAQRIQRATITPDLIQLRAIEKWDGVLPHVTGGGALPFINID